MTSVLSENNRLFPNKHAQTDQVDDSQIGTNKAANGGIIYKEYLQVNTFWVVIPRKNTDTKGNDNVSETQ